MRTVGLEQGSKCWHDWRDQGIGASDAAHLVGHAAWNSPAKLLEIKSGVNTFKGNALTRRGSRLEPVARQLVEAVTGLRFRPACVIHDEHEFIKASLDGITDDGKVVLEIKCPKNSKYHSLALAGKVPDHYRPQVQHQLMICQQADLLIFASYFPQGVYSRRLALVKVKHDKRYQKRLLDREVKFWTVEMNRPTGKTNVTSGPSVFIGHMVDQDSLCGTTPPLPNTLSSGVVLTRYCASTRTRRYST